MVEDGLKRQDGAAAAYVAAKVAGIRDRFAVRAQCGARQRHADEIRVYVE
jgi:bacterioferritin-associated ferredoxin